MTLMRFAVGTATFYSAFQFGERRGGLLISHPIYINSGNTGMMGSWESGNVELLTLTLSFPCNRKRYYIECVFGFLGVLEEVLFFKPQIDVERLAFWASDLV